MTQLTITKNGENKTIPIGFSWSTLLFGFFPALLRGDIKWSIIMLICAIVTSGISLLVFPFIYNKIYIKTLLVEGYRPLNKCDDDLMKSHGIYRKDSFDGTIDALAKKDTNSTISKENKAGELKEWHDLLKSEVITKEEFKMKKKEILGFSNDEI